MSTPTLDGVAPDPRAKGTLFDSFPLPCRAPVWRVPAQRRSFSEAVEMLIGYARVSTTEQNLELQVDALERAGCERIFSDIGFSGSLTRRPALDKMIASLNPGDTLVTWRLDRLGRSLGHLISLVTDLETRQITFKSLSDAIDTRTPGGRLQFHMLGALAEFERSLISERTRAGMAAARAKGARIGRPAKLDAAKVDAAIAQVKRNPLSKLAKRLDVSPITLRRAISVRRRLCG